MKATYEHRIPASLDQVINAYRNPQFYEERQHHFGALSIKILKWDEDRRGEISYRVQVTEPSRKPSFIRQSDVDTYIEESILDINNRTLSWKIIPDVGADKFFMSGLLEFKPEDDGNTVVVFHIEFNVKIPLVGTKLEQYIISKTEEETAKQAAFLKNWVAAASTAE